MGLAIGMDIGGTQLRIGVIDDAGEALLLESGNSFSQEEPDRLIQAIVETIASDPVAKAREREPLVGLGIGIAGLVAMESGTVCHSPHFPKIEQLPLKNRLEAELPGIPIVVDNDANCLALGEAWKGVPEWRDFLLVAIGTGIGGGIIRGGAIDRGTNGLAGEIGHLCIDRNGPHCPCGSRGCWETLASGSGLSNLVKTSPRLTALPGSSLGEALFALANNGDPLALTIYEKLGRNLAIGLGSLVSVTGLHRIVLAGGLCEAKHFFTTALDLALPQWTYTHRYVPIEIHFSSLTPWSGVYGAARLVFEQQKKTKG